MIKDEKKQSVVLPERLLKMRENYRSEGIPSALCDTLFLLCEKVNELKPKKILEIGTATGVSGTAMLLSSPESRLTTIEKNEENFDEAKITFEKFGVEKRVKQILADAGEVLNFTDEKFDFVFLDGAKARYYDYLYDLDRILVKGGTLFADNVLFRGYVDGGVKYRHRDNTIVRNMRAFLKEINNPYKFETVVLDIGDGVSISKKL